MRAETDLVDIVIEEVHEARAKLIRLGLLLNSTIDAESTPCVEIANAENRPAPERLELLGTRKRIHIFILIKDNIISR